ncbi:MAG: hypothetical protein LBM72_00800 [Mycoplasmataceae bacterium]|jgi:predicted PurR-regulated permease PerM|nr:hypothetical protein [Mycoplasmataceae bacterium]
MKHLLSGSVNTTGVTVLIIVGCVVLLLALFAIVYMIVAYRKIGIVAKKLDYLVEDLTYKSEMLTPTVEALVKVSNYIDLLESAVAQNSNSLGKYLISNKTNVSSLIDKLKKGSKGAK